MTLSDIKTKIYALTGTDSTSYPDANMLIDINLWYQKVVSMILESQDETDWDDSNQTKYPIFKIPLLASRDIRIPQSINMLKVKDVSVCYDGTNIYRSTPYDIAEGNYPVADAANTAAQLKIDENMSRTSPRHDIRWNSVWLYPMPTAADVAAGGYMVVETFRGPKEFTSGDLSTGTAQPGFDSTFHPILAYGPATEYEGPKQLPQLKRDMAMLADYEVRLRQQYSSKELDRNYALSSDYQSYK